MASPGASHVYVYYRVAGESAAARATISTLMAEVEATTGVAGRLLVRWDDPHTWLEVYEPVNDTTAFMRQLAALVRRFDAKAVAQGGERHLERFAAPPPLERPVTA